MVTHPSDTVTNYSHIEKSKELVGEFFEEEKEGMHKRIKELFERTLANPRVMTTINLSLCKLGEMGAYQLANLISHTPDISVLKLWKCRIGAKGAEFLADHLGKLSKLRVLALEDNCLGVEGASFLQRSILKLPFLEELYLHENQLGIEGAKVIAKALSQLSELRILTMDENDIRTEGLTAVLSEVKAGMIATLGLAYNNIDEAGCNLLIQRSVDFVKLEKLSFDGNPHSQETHEALVTAFKEVKII